MCRASAEDKYYAIRLTKYSFKKRKKKLKTQWGPYILPHKNVNTFMKKNICILLANFR